MISTSEIECVLAKELNDNDEDSEDLIKIDHIEETRRASDPCYSFNQKYSSPQPTQTRSLSAPTRITLEKAVGFQELESIREKKAITGKISLRQHGFIFIPVDADETKTKSKKEKSELMQIQLINEYVRGHANVYLLDYFMEPTPKSIRGDMDFYLHLQCNVRGAVCFNYAHIAMEKYMKHRYNVVYDDRRKPNHNIMAFSAIYETVIGRGTCAQFLTQTFYSMLDMILAKRLNSKNAPRKAEKIWMSSIALTFKKMDKLYEKWVEKQGISQSASNCTQVIVSKQHIYVCNLGSGGAFLWNGEKLQLITQRHISRCKFEGFRVLSAGGKIEEKEIAIPTLPIDIPINNNRRTKPKFTRTAWNSSCNDEVTDSLPADFKYVQKQKTIEQQKQEKSNSVRRLVQKWKAKIHKFVIKQSITSYEPHTLAFASTNDNTTETSGTFSNSSGSCNLFHTESSIGSVEKSKESVQTLSPELSNHSNVAPPPKISKTAVVTPGHISATRVFGLITTKKKCIDENKPKLWITEPHIVKLRRTKDIKAIILVSSEILDTINIKKTQSLLTKAIQKGTLRAFCEKLCYKCESKGNTRSTIASLVAFPQKSDA